MTFTSGWALLGLLLLAPLVALHLRDRGRPAREVPSLVVWQELELEAPPGERGRRRPPLPLLLLLQAIALVAIVTALAQPHLTRATPPPEQVVVLDDSLWMSAPGRLASAERALEQISGAARAGAPFAVVLADGAPHVLYRGKRSGVAAALSSVRASAAPDSLASALSIAAGLLGGSRDRVTLIRALEDPLPRVSAAAGELRAVTIGSPIADRGIFAAAARCGIGQTDVCEISAIVRNSGPAAADVSYSAQASGRRALSLSVHVGAHASAPIVLAATPGEQVVLRLRGSDTLAADDAAWVTVPGEDDLPNTAAVTLVGDPTQAAGLARALASVPGVSLRLLTPAQYRASYARASGLVVLDGWVPHGALPPAPAVVLVDPPRLAGGHVGGALSDAILSGTDGGNALLDGVDLSSLQIDHGGARLVALPSWMSELAWSPDGPLIAAGDNGRQRVGLLAFEPADSDLSQLASFPVLAANFVRWAAAWAPGSAGAGVPILIDATPQSDAATLSRNGVTVERTQLDGRPAALVAPTPGAYTITETGAHLSRSASLSVDAATPAAAGSAPVDLITARVASHPGPGPSLDPWLLAVALAVLILEWLYWSSRRRRAVR